MNAAAKNRKPTRFEITVSRIAQVVADGHVLVAHNALAGEDMTVGPYQEAVDRGVRFACLSVKGRSSDAHVRTANEAALWFVDSVGTSRANDAAKAAAKRHGLVLAV